MKPKDISDLFYQRELRDDLCPIVAGRRIIPESYLDMIHMALKRHGRPVAELGPVQTQVAHPRRGVASSESFHMAPDFDAPLEDFADYR